MAQKQILIVSYSEKSNYEERTLDSADELIKEFDQIGIDDCSTDLSLRGYPVVKGLVGPIPESRTAVRYETRKAFEQMTKEWAATKTKRRRRTKAAIEAEAAAQAAAPSEGLVPPPIGLLNTPMQSTPLPGATELT